MSLHCRLFGLSQYFLISICFPVLQPQNSVVCSQLSFHSAHYQISKRPRHAATHFNLCVKNKEPFPTLTDTDSPCCLVSISDSQVNFPNNLLRIDKARQHAQHRPSGQCVSYSGFLGCHALLGKLSGGAWITSQWAREGCNLLNLLTGHISSQDSALYTTTCCILTTSKE